MRRKPFTLVELLIAMSVLSVFMLGLMQFYSTTETVMSAGSNRTEMFERARIAMDMMANDLSCVFYSQTDDQMKPFVSTSTSFTVATIRPEKLDTTAKTNIVGVEYSWNSGKRELLYATSKKDVFSITGGIGGGETLVEGVTDFKVTANYSGSKTLPDSVLITMKLLDKKTMQRLEAKAGSESDILDNADIREFRRLVVIDRGQRNHKSD